MTLKEKALKLAMAIKFHGIEVQPYDLMTIILSYEKLNDDVIPFSIETAQEIGVEIFKMRQADSENNSLQEP